MEEKSGEVMAEVGTIDVSLLRLRQSDELRCGVIEKIFDACSRYGYFQVMNHGIADSVIAEAVDVNLKFFEMGMEAQEELMSNDVHLPARFSKPQFGGFSRDFLKLYAHPLHQFIDSWPRFPPEYREKMGAYSREVRKLSVTLFGAIMESLQINGKHLKQSFEEGFQIVGMNYYGPTLGGEATITGTPPHSDHSIITLLLQNAAGLEVIGEEGGSWKSVPEQKGSLVVLVGDHLEVISNGVFKSVLHRAIQRCCDGARLSVASFHNLGMDEKVEPAAELVCDQNPEMYKGSSLGDYLHHLASGDKTPFIQTIKK